MRQGDAIACLLFNIALEKVIRDLAFRLEEPFSLRVQILAYADDIDLMARTTLGLNEAFLNLEKSARNRGLVINQEKTVSSYGGSQEECARLRESVPYVKLYRYNPKHLCPK